MVSARVIARRKEDYPSLLDRHISKIRFEFPPQLGTLREGTVRNFKLAEVYGGGSLRRSQDMCGFGTFIFNRDYGNLSCAIFARAMPPIS